MRAESSKAIQPEAPVNKQFTEPLRVVISRHAAAASHVADVSWGLSEAGKQGRKGDQERRGEWEELRAAA
jgi:hypothetical protein